MISAPIFEVEPTPWTLSAAVFVIAPSISALPEIIILLFPPSTVDPKLTVEPVSVLEALKVVAPV